MSARFDALTAQMERVAAACESTQSRLQNLEGTVSAIKGHVERLRAGRHGGDASPSPNARQKSRPLRLAAARPNHAAAPAAAPQGAAPQGAAPQGASPPASRPVRQRSDSMTAPALDSASFNSLSECNA